MTVDSRAVLRPLLAIAFSWLAAPTWAQRPAELETIVVRAARLPISIAASGSAITTIDADDLRNRQSAAIADVLRSVPGIALSRSGGAGALSQIRLRGGEANHVAVFVDGVKLNDPAVSSEYNFAHLLAYGVESVEVVRGPQSALWGSDALSGVINVTTVAPVDGLDLGAQAESGGDGWRQLGASASAAGPRSRFSLHANRLETDGYNISRAGSEADGYDNTSIALGAGFDVSDAIAVDVRLRSTDATTEIDGTDFATGLPTDRLDTNDAAQASGMLRATVAMLDGRWTHELAVGRLDTDNASRSESPFAASGFDVFTSAAVVDTSTYQTTYQLAAAHRVTAAFEHRSESFVQRGPIGFGDPNRDEEMRFDSRIVEYEGSPAPAISLLVSLRDDGNSDFEDTTTARVTAAFRISESTRARAAYGEGVKHPTFTERFGFFTDFAGNPALRPESSAAWELGFDRSFVRPNLRLGATAFDESLTDEINGFAFDAATGQFTAVNEDGESRRTGLEIEGRWQPAEALSVAFAYTWLDADEPDALSGERTPEIRRAATIASATVNWSAAASRLNLNLHIDYNGRQDDVYFPPVPPFQERVSLDAFTLVALAARYRITASFELFGRIENLLDEDYEEVFGYVAPGRSAYLGVRYRRGAAR